MYLCLEDEGQEEGTMEEEDKEEGRRGVGGRGRRKGGGGGRGGRTKEQEKVVEEVEEGRREGGEAEGAYEGALSMALAQKGIFVTVIDFSEEKGKEVVLLIERENTKFHPKPEFPSAIFVKCDVTDTNGLAAAFEKHLEVFGGLDICINSAGISHLILFHEDKTNGIDTWKRTINVNLTAVVDCTRIA
ncbi:hypothetical protein B296_00009601, partial [Ensete ventricosum]